MFTKVTSFCDRIINMAIYKIDETELYYEVIGEGIPFLIVHGWAIDHRYCEYMLEPAFKMSEKSFKRVYIDVPGMGQSKPGKVKNGDGVLRVLDAFMDDVFKEERFYIGGNSFGAGVARAYTALHPEKVLGLLLLVPSTGVLGKLPKKGVYEKDAEFIKTLSPRQTAAFTCMNAILTKEKYEIYKEQVMPSVIANDDNDFLHHTFKGRYSFDIDAALRKKPFKGSVLIVCGKYDKNVGYEDQISWLELFPSSSYVCIDRAGHNIFVDQPEMFNNTVVGWLKEIG